MARGIGEAASLLGFCTPCDFVHARPVSREWHALLIRRMDSVASIYRLAAMLSRGKGRLRAGVEFHLKDLIEKGLLIRRGRTNRIEYALVDGIA